MEPGRHVTPGGHLWEGAVGISALTHPSAFPVSKANLIGQFDSQ